MKPSKRDQLVRTAAELFYKNGYHATGIDKILAAAGVSKPTLYRYFRSKEELIVAALRRRDDEFIVRLRSATLSSAMTPCERVLSVFDVFQAWFDEEGFQGCMFINAVAEYPELDDEIHRAAADHKRKASVHVGDLVAAAGVENPAEVTGQLMLLIEGAIVTAHTTGSSESARCARKMAETILSQNAREQDAGTITDAKLRH